MAGPPVDLGGGVWQFQTNTLLAAAGGEVLLGDPNWEPAELEEIRAEAARLAPGGAIRIVVTHADYDHVCGLGFFTGAQVAAGPETAEKIASGVAADGLRGASVEWGLEWPTDLRVDRVVKPGDTAELGAFRLEAIDARGHVADGLAWVLVDQGVMFPGDYVSSMTYPFVVDSVERARETVERLAAALDEHELRWVVPGHGRALAPDEARLVAAADLAYLEALQAAARDAVDRGLSPGHAAVAVYSEVEPPRPTTDDFELFGLRELNARAAVAEARA